MNVLNTYSKLIKKGGYFIVEDGICHHGLEVGPEPGPYEAIEAFVEQNNDFEIDRNMESFFYNMESKRLFKEGAVESYTAHTRSFYASKFF